MKKTCVIAGILSILAGIYVFMVPGSSMMIIAWMLILIQLFSGVGIIFGYFQDKKNKMHATAGAGNLLLGILMAVFAVIAMSSDSIKAMMALMITIIFIVNLVMNGITNIAQGISKVSRFPLLSIILGVLLILVGVEGILSIFIAAITMDIFMAMGLFSLGFTFLASAKTAA